MSRPRSPKPTPRQRQALRLIKALTVTVRVPPTVRSLAQAMGVSSSTAFFFVKELRARGFVERRGSLRILR